jgi:hypothetical protein
MRRIFELALLTVAVVGSVLAVPPSAPAPEIDPGTGASALTLLSGVLLVIRGRRKR